MSAYSEAVAAALEALRIESATSFSWCGEAGPRLPAEVAAAMPPDTARAYLRDQLRSRLYTSFYCSGRPVPPLPRPLAERPHPASPFIDALSRANSGTGSREAGWRVERIDGDGRIVVSQHGLSLWARPEEVEGELTPGGEVSVVLPSELLRLSPGFYMALGNVEVNPEEPLTRHYWNLSSPGGEALIAAGTRVLNRAGLPFRLKVLLDPAGYSRCDAGVLYTPRRLQEEVAGLLPEILEEVSPHLQSRSPAFTKPLARGLAVAEDPPGGESFGTHRCDILAGAAIEAFELGALSISERLGVVERAFAQHGVDFDRPYLNAGSADEYELVA